MPDSTGQSKDQLDILRSLPLEESTEEKVETLWRQLMVYKSFADGDLSEAKARRAHAEGEREQAEKEALRATQDLCERMRVEAERKLEEAEHIKAQAINIRQEAETELGRLGAEKAKADNGAKRIVAEAQERAQEILDQARMAAQQETTDHRRQALKEIRNILTRVEDVRAAVTEELETQRILTNVSKMKNLSGRALTVTTRGDGQDQESEADAAIAQPMANGGSEASSPQDGIKSTSKTSKGKKTSGE